MDVKFVALIPADEGDLYVRWKEVYSRDVDPTARGPASFVGSSNLLSERESGSHGHLDGAAEPS